MLMWKIYLKQAWAMLRQNRLFSSIYVVGTGLSIALTMTVFIIFYVKTAPIYPEYNRDRMLVLKFIKYHSADESKGYMGGHLSIEVSTLLDSLPHLEAMAMAKSSFFSENDQVALPGQKQPFNVRLLLTNDGFWRVFTFRFVSGKPFTSEDYQARRHTAVLSESTARRLFASVDVAGRTFLYKGNPYTVSGVVEDVSSATPNAVADMWMPLTDDLPSLEKGEMLRGNLIYYLLADAREHKEALREEVRDAFRRYDAGQEWFNDLLGQPDDVALASFRTDSMAAPDLSGLVRSLLYIVLALLFIPAINLSGMIASRMDKRMAELGIRKAYGATRGMLLGQVLWENLLLTLLGAVAGLVFCYVIVLASGSWILTLFDAQVNADLPVPFLTMEMLFNPGVFFSAFGLCLVLNVLSALLPAWMGLRHTIVQELYAKR